MRIPRPVIFGSIWLCLAILAARMDPAALQLFTVLTIFILIAHNLGERREGLSAYSVFNKGCEPILGQTSAEQFDNEMRHRPTETREQPNSRNTAADEDLLESVRREILQESRRGPRLPRPETRPRRRR